MGGQPATDCSLVHSDPGELVLEDQADVEALKNGAKIADALSVTGNVSDLSPLEFLQEVGGDLAVLETEALKDTSQTSGNPSGARRPVAFRKTATRA